MKGKGGARGSANESSTRSERTGSGRYSSGNNRNTDNVLEYIPHEYLSRPDKAEPALFYLPKMVLSSGMAGVSNSSITPSNAPGGAAGADPAAAASSGVSTKTSSSSKFPNLRVLLAAAEDDVRLHRARQQAGRNRDPKLLQTYKIETDTSWLARQGRLNERDLLLGKLDTERHVILKELLEGNTSGLTAKEATAIQLARWQRALELYVYDPPVRNSISSNNAMITATAAGTAGGAGGGAGEATKGPGGGQKKQQQLTNLDFLGLLEKLMETSAEVRIVNPRVLVCQGGNPDQQRSSGHKELNMCCVPPSCHFLAQFHRRRRTCRKH
jgi:hypothetical protein